MPEPIWGNLPIFPPILTKSNAGRESRTDHTESIGREVFNARWSDRRWRFSLAGAAILAGEIETWDAFCEIIDGMASPFLFRVPGRRFQVTRGQVGVGNGVQTAFQLCKVRSYQGGNRAEKVRFPVHNYPPIYFAGNHSIALATEYVRVFLNGVETTAWPNGGWDVNRETGLVTFSAAPASGTLITATFKYFVKVHGQDWMPASSENNIYWELDSGAELFEPKEQ